MFTWRTVKVLQIKRRSLTVPYIRAFLIGFFYPSAMDKTTLGFLTVVFAYGVLLCTGQKPEWRPECREWDNVTDVLNNEKRVTMQCTKNSHCSGFDCSGTYAYEGFFNQGQFQLNFCYGLKLLQCEHPIALFFYLSLPDSKEEYSHIIRNSTPVQLPHVHYDIQMGQADGFVQVEMTEINLPRRRYVQLGLTFLLRVSMNPGGYEIWPDSFKLPLMPETKVQVPPCYKSQTQGIPTPPSITTCKGLNISSTTPSPLETTTAGATGRPCGQANDTGEFYICDNNEYCSEDTGMCMCAPEYIRDPQTGTCKYIMFTTIRVIDGGFDDGNNVTPASSSGLSKTNLIVIVCVVAVAIVAAVIVVTFVVRYRRHQARYGQHELLSSNDDDPLDVAT